MTAEEALAQSRKVVDEYFKIGTRELAVIARVSTVGCLTQAHSHRSAS